MGINDTFYRNFCTGIDNIFRQSQNISGMISNTNFNCNEVACPSFAHTFQNTMQSQCVSDVPDSLDTIFEEAAQLYHVPSGLLKAIGKVESNFNPSIVSSAGAQGVMQLMPDTAKSLGVEDPFDARSNIMGGAKYIAQKLKEYDGDIDLALAAYNAGSGNVKKYGGVPPFKETQNYIRKVKDAMGTDITVNQTVSTKRNAEVGTGVTAQDALYMLELMKMQLQSRITMSGNRSSNENTEENLLLL